MSPTRIEWVTNPDGTKGETWNPVSGCTKVSAGCKNCYAERMAKRLAGRCGYPEAPHQFDVTLHPDRLEQPLRWKKSRTVFVCSMSDLFHEDVPFDYVDEIFGIMAEAPQHSFQLLTKRPERAISYISDANLSATNVETHLVWPLPNVWLGVTAENQATADERIPLLLETPAAVRFVSCEPLLGPVRFDYEDWDRTAEYMEPKTYLRSYTIDNGARRMPGIDWVIVGAETGPGARPMHPDWARDIRDQCQEAGVPFFFKKMSGRQPIPDDLQIREMPE